MRVISGRFKGFQLPSAKTGTRPTTDRTKEAMFSRLDALGLLDDAHVLDLFAGTGALGIEALSRGACELLAAEAAGPASAILAKTLKSLQQQQAWKPNMRARVMRKPAERMAAGYHGSAFDVIFADPPYDFTTDACNGLMTSLVASGAASAGSTMLIERSARSEPLTPPDGWIIADQRDYGETRVFTIGHE